MSSSGHEFRKLEYQALRAEILATQQRDFQLIGIGILVIPALNYVRDAWAAPLVIFIPAVAGIVMLLHLANEHAIMRCAEYIRECVETELGKDRPDQKQPVGWETWLKESEISSLRYRGADWYMRVAVMLLLSAYFFAALWAASEYAFRRGFVSGMTLLGAYGLAGLWLVPHTWNNIPKRQAKDRPKKVPEPSSDVTVSKDGPRLPIAKTAAERHPEQGQVDAVVMPSSPEKSKLIIKE